VQVKCVTPLESSQGELQVCLRPHPDQRFEQKIMTSQNPGSPNQDSFETPLWESRDRKPFGCRCRGERHKVYYMGEGGGFPRVQVVVNHVSPKLPVACLSTKSAPKSELTNLLVNLIQVRVNK
jgi:hypothetical protein